SGATSPTNCVRRWTSIRASNSWPSTRTCSSSTTRRSPRKAAASLNVNIRAAHAAERSKREGREPIRYRLVRSPASAARHRRNPLLDQLPQQRAVATRFVHAGRRTKQSNHLSLSYQLCQLLDEVLLPLPLHLLQVVSPVVFP